MKRMLNHMTAGQPRSLIRPILYSTLANLSALAPYTLVVAALSYLLAPSLEPGSALRADILWWLSGGLCAAMLLQYGLEMKAYQHQFRSAYQTAAAGRTRLANHLRRLPMNAMQKREPGDLVHMMMGDFTMVEYGLSHLAPQLIGAILMPVVALAGLMLVDWRLAAALLAALPLTFLIMLGATRLMRRLGASQQRARLDALNLLQQYLQGIRVIKAHHLTGHRFKRLDEAFHELMKRSIRVESVLGPIVLGAAGIMRAGLALIIVTGVYLLLDGTLALLTFAAFLVIGTRIFDPLTSSLVQYAEFRFFEQAGERINGLLSESVMSGSQAPTAQDADEAIGLQQVTYRYGDKKVLDGVSVTIPPRSFTAIV